ncbi:MAG TPA: hypothetical protein PK165_04565 [bacterium]|nr:hypothetical protein [bacterium]HOL49065.1 hypothetical protein [bacterium]HPO52085.1 hypothetical protein [bacterium]
MGILNEDERARVIEEEEIRVSVRRKYEQKSSGVAAVLSTLCPGLGQVYNGQFGKGALFFITVVVGLVLFVWGLVATIKEVRAFAGGHQMSTVSEGTGISSEKPVPLTEEGIVVEEVEKEEKAQTEGKQEKQEESITKYIPKKYVAFTIIGIILMVGGAGLAVKDAIKIAKRINQGIVKG